MSHFFRLPRELRDIIYQHVLIEIYGDMGWFVKGRIIRFPGILLACRQVREEAITIYYRANCFGFECHRDVPLIPSKIGLVPRMLIVVDGTYRNAIHSHIGLDVRQGLDRYKLNFEYEEDYSEPEMVEVIQSAKRWLDEYIAAGNTIFTKESFGSWLEHIISNSP